MPFVLALIAGVSILRAPVAAAQPSPANSTLPAQIWLVGQSVAGVPDPIGLATVTVRDVANNPVPGAQVRLDFTNAPDLDFSKFQNYAGMSTDCSTHSVYATAGSNGVASFIVVGGCINHPGGGYSPGPCAVHVSANTVPLGDTQARAFDLDGVNGITTADAAIFVEDLQCGSHTCVADYVNNDGALTLADLSALITVIDGGNSVQSGVLCGGLTAPPNSIQSISGGITITTTQCNAPSNLSYNYCQANKVSDFYVNVSLTAALPAFTGVHADLILQTVNGANIPAYFAFQPGGCHLTFLRAVDPEEDNNGDPNCIEASTAYLGATPAPLTSANAALPYPGTVAPNPLSTEQLLVDYVLGDCMQGSIPANTPTTVLGVRIVHGANPATCAGCGTANNVVIGVKSLTLTNAIAGVKGTCCPVPQRGPLTALDDQPYVLTVTPGPGDQSALAADGTVPIGAVPPPPSNTGTTWLAPPAPNPSDGGALVRWTLARAEPGSVGIYDAAGRRVRALASGDGAAGPHAASWDGRDDAGARVPAGLYFIRLRTDEGTRVRTIVLRN